MKSGLLKYLFLFSIVSIFLAGCKKDDTGSEVSVAEGKISTSTSTEKVTYTITDIQTIIVGDTTTIVIESLSSDSVDYIYMGFQKIANFGERNYDITSFFQNDTSVSMVYAYKYSVEDGKGYSKTSLVGTVKVLKYIENDELQGSFELAFPNSESDTVSTEIMKGEFYASYTLLDPNRVPNISITPRTMVVTINGIPTQLTSEGGLLPEENEIGYVVNGTLATGQTITLSFKYFLPKINKTYTIGENIIETPDSSGLVEATYHENGLTYFADINHGSGKISVSKITSTTLQGTFFFTATLLNDTSKKVILNEGMYYTRFKAK